MVNCKTASTDYGKPLLKAIGDIQAQVIKISLADINKSILVLNQMLKIIIKFLFGLKGLLNVNDDLGKRYFK